MKIITKYAFLLSVVMLSACSADDETTKNENTIITNPVETEMSFSASIEDGNITRTAFSEYNSGTKNYLKTVWTVADAIRIYNIAATNNNNGSFAIKEGGIDENDGKQAVFTGEKITSNGSDDKFYAVYPDKNTNTSFSQEGDVVKLNATLPAVQTAITNNINPDLQFMTGYTTKRNFDFKNVVSFIKVTIANSTTAGKFKIHAIRFTSNNSENKIAGSFTATVTEGANPDISSVSTGAASSVVVENADQSQLADGVYYIAVLPTTLTSGFTLQLEDLTSGKERIYQRKSTASYTIARSKVIDLGSYNAESGLENGTIYDGGIIDLGLPDGTLWATRNVAGAKKLFVDNVYDYGNFYGWGEDFGYNETTTKGTNDESPYCDRKVQGLNLVFNKGKTKTKYEWDTYRFSSYGTLDFLNAIPNMGKYNSSDGITVLDDADDIAYEYSKNLAYKFRMPTNEQMSNLYTNVTVSAKAKHPNYTGNENGKGQGFKLTSKIPGYTSRSLWLPAAGACFGQLLDGGTLFDPQEAHLKNIGITAQYWTKTLYTGNRQYAYCLDLPSVNLTDRRYAGRSIRPVLVK